MIALKDNLPLVQFESGETHAFDRRWLVRSLVRAAQKAGYKKWWLAQHVAESVTSYLFLGFDENVVTIPRLSKAVQSVLQVIGYGEVAQHFAPYPPPVQISLLDLAREAGSGYELAFFEMLRRRIQGLISQRATHLEIFSLEPCVKTLRARKVWSRDCDALRSEIVQFVREQFSAQDGEVLFSLS
jgi:hypothetical protein